MRKFAVCFAALGFAALSVSSAHAAPVNCPGTAATTDREFTIDTTPSATCLASAAGNLNGSGDAINALGWTTLDKSDDNTTGGIWEGALTLTPPTSGLSGTFTIDANVWNFFGEIVLALKSGEGQLNPDWAAFTIPFGVTSGSWAVSGQQELSHGNLYGRGTPDIPIPEPGTMMLVGAGLAGIAARRRRRSQA